MPSHSAAPDEFHSSESRRQLLYGSLPLQPLSARVNVLPPAPLVRPETIRCPDADHPPAYSPSLPSEIFLHFFPCKNQFWSLRKCVLPSQDHNSGSCTAASSEHSVPDCQYSPILALACIQRSDRMPFFDSYSTSSAASPSLSAPEAPANAPHFSHEPALSPHRSKPPL